MAQSFRSEDFFADVVTAVNDLHVQGFNALEEHIAKELNLSSPEQLEQLKEAVDAVFVKVQTAVDKSLENWEKYCVQNTFVPLRVEAEKEVVEATRISSEADAVDAAKEAEIDAQLNSLRSQILTTRRDCSKLNKEYQTLEAWLSSKRAKVDAVSRASTLLDNKRLSAIEAEISRAVASLRERMKNAETETLKSNPLDKKSKAALAKRLQEAL